MTLEALTNRRWGFESMCFVCDPANAQGMRIPFFHDDEAQTVIADFTLTEVFSSAPAIAHGGILMALLDEAMSWAAIALAGTWALTASNAHRFLRPVRIGHPYRVEGRLVGRDDAGIHATATIARASTGKVAVVAEGLFAPIGAAQAADAVGVELGTNDRRYLTERRPARIHDQHE